jgi:uracil-DNA glycosylase
MTDREKSLREKLGDSWFDKIGYEFSMDYMNNLSTRIANERSKGKKIFPSTENIFNCFKYTNYENVKVVIVSQDPYYNEVNGKPVAHGLSFSSNDESYMPPSLKEIYDEIEEDIQFGLYLNRDPNLTYWTQQGVFLLNKVLTVEKGLPNSHKNWGWEIFTMKVIKLLSQHSNRLVFMLWGSHAQEFEKLIDKEYHLVLKAPHPVAHLYNSGVNFRGCKHFSKCNNFLKENGYGEINW